MERRTVAGLATGLAVVGGTSAAIYKNRIKLRIKALRLLANGSPVVLNARISEGTLEMNDSDGAVIANLDLIGVDYEPLRKLAQALVDTLSAKAEGTVGIRADSLTNAHFLDSRFSGLGTGVRANGS